MKKSTSVYDNSDDADVWLKAVKTSTNTAPKLKISSENGKLSIGFVGNLLKRPKFA